MQGGGEEVVVLAIVIVIMLVFLVFMAVAIVVYCLFLRTLSRCLQRVRPELRAMEPGMVWLNLIPLFSLGWIFYTVISLRRSLEAEYMERGLPPDGDYGQGLGIAYGVLLCCGMIPYIGALAGLAGLVLWILYWVRMHGINQTLPEPALAEPVQVAGDRYDGPRVGDGEAGPFTPPGTSRQS